MVALKRIVLNGVVALMVWSPTFVLHAAEPAPSRQAAMPLSHASAEFLAETAQKNLSGMMLGFQAIQKSDSDRVRVYARYLIDDSVKLNKELMELARRNKVLVPLDAIVAPNPALIALGKKSASEFDRAFILYQIQLKKSLVYGK